MAYTYQTNPGQTTGGNHSLLKDLALAPARGAVGFTQGLYGLADTLTLDSLPDWKENPLGESKTAAGGIVQGLTNFGLGFVPVLGWVGKGGKVAKTGVRLFGGLSDDAIKQAGGLGKFGRTIGKETVAGAITDFAVFQGHDGRLSDIIQQYPALQNPITEMLSSDEDDSEIVGRLKNTLEGAGLGVFLDSVVAGVRHMRGVKKALAENPEASLEQLTKAGDDEAGGLEAYDSAFYDIDKHIEELTDADARAGGRLRETSHERALGQAEEFDGLDGLFQRKREVLEEDQAIRREVHEASGIDLDELTDEEIDSMGLDRDDLIDIDQGVLSPQEEYLLLSKGLDNLEEDELATIAARQEAAQKASEGAVVMQPRKPGENIDAQTQEASQATQQGLLDASEAEGGPTGVFQDSGAAEREAGARVRAASGDGAPVRGASNFTNRLKTEIKRGKLIDAGDDMDTIEAFIDRVGPRLFEDVGVSVRLNDNADAAATYNFGTSIVTLFRDTIKEGELKRATVHELWHSLSRYLPGEKLAVVRADFEKARSAAMAKDASLEARLQNKTWSREEYRFTDIDEWFAEEMTDASLRRLVDYSAATQSVIARAKLIFKEFITGLRAKFGHKRTQAMVDDFFNGRIDTKARNYDLQGRWSTRAQGVEKRVGGISAAKLGRLGIDESSWSGLEDAVKAARQESGDAAENSAAALEKWLKGNQNQLNIRHLEGRDGVQYLIRAIDDLFDDVFRAEVKSLEKVPLSEQMSQGMDEVGRILGNDDPQQTLAQMLRGAQGDVVKARSRMLAARTLLVSFSDQLKTDAAKFLEAGGTDVAAEHQILRMLRNNILLQAELKGVQAEFGRGLGSLRQAARLADLPMSPFDNTDQGMRDNLEEWMSNLGGREKFHGFLEELVTANGKGGVDGAARQAALLAPAGSKNFWGITSEYFINSILSGGKTQSINVLSGFMYGMYRPLERALGSALTLNGTQLGESLREASKLLGGYTRAFSDLFTLKTRMDQGKLTPLGLGWKAAREGDAILDKGGKTLDTGNFKAIASDRQDLMGDAINAAGKFIRVPTAALRGTDEFIKQVVYRNKAATILESQGIAAGKTGVELSDYVEEALQKVTRDGQMYTQETMYQRGVEVAKGEGIEEPGALAKRAKAWAAENWDPELGATAKMALDEARHSTFSTPLRDQQGFMADAGKALQKLAIQHPMMKMVVPFVRTPLNIAQAAKTRLIDPTTGLMSLLNPLDGKVRGAFLGKEADIQAVRDGANKFLADFFSNDPGKRAEAMGRTALASGAVIGLTGLVASGDITGKGPSDPNLRRLLMSNGWQEYSFRTKDGGYISYARLDPFATILGTVADFFDYSRWAQPDESEMEMMSYGLMTAVANNFTNKTYLQGLGNFVEAMNAPDRNMARFVENYARSAAPYSGFSNQSIIGPTDDHVRSVQGVLDAFISRVPGLAHSLDPVRDVLGRPVERTRALGSDKSMLFDAAVPINFVHSKEDSISKEFLKLKHGFSKPGSKLLGGLIELNDYETRGGQNAYDRYQQLAGTVKVGGQTLEASLKKVIRSNRYKRLSDVSTADVESPRIRLLNTIIQRYRREARRQLFREIPALKERERGLKLQVQLARRGR
tara:strand:- start:3577 stop:8439 length:4863 start_codon:yes stop_codon:yes gene_type:complete